MDAGSNNSGDHRLSYIERIESLEVEIKDLNSDKRDAGDGFDVKAVKAIVRYRAQDPGKQAEADAVFTTYLRAIQEGELLRGMKGATRAGAGDRS